jgi:hypothetical protein
VPFDRGSLDDGGVARRRVVGDALLAAERLAFGIVGEVDGGAVLSQVHDPRIAAPSTGIPSHVDGHVVGRGSRSWI